MLVGIFFAKAHPLQAGGDAAGGHVGPFGGPTRGAALQQRGARRAGTHRASAFRCNRGVVVLDGACTWSLRSDPLKNGRSLPKIKGLRTHVKRVMQTPGKGFSIFMLFYFCFFGLGVDLLFVCLVFWVSQRRLLGRSSIRSTIQKEQFRKLWPCKPPKHM